MDLDIAAPPFCLNQKSLRLTGMTLHICCCIRDTQTVDKASVFNLPHGGGGWLVHQKLVKMMHT